MSGKVKPYESTGGPDGQTAAGSSVPEPTTQSDLIHCSDRNISYSHFKNLIKLLRGKVSM